MEKVETMANEDLGTCPCPFSGEPVPVRKAKSGKYPLYLYTDFTGPCPMRTAKGQAWIMARAAFTPGKEPANPVYVGQPAEPETQEKPVYEKKPVNEPAPKRDRWGFVGDI